MEAIDGALAAHRIGEGSEPLAGATVRSHDQRAGAVSLGEDLVSVSALVGVHGVEAEVVDLVWNSTLIDESGFDQVERSHSRQAASLLYRVIDQRHSRRSTALVTNVDFAAWPGYLGDAPLSMVFIDRLLDRAVVIKNQRRSYRVERPKA